MTATRIRFGTKGDSMKKLMVLGAMLGCSACVLAIVGCSGGQDKQAVVYTLPFNYVEPEQVADSLRFPEGPAMDKAGNLYFVGLGMSDIKKIAPDGTVSSYFETGGHNQSLLMDKDGTLYIAHRSREANDPEGIYALEPDMKYRAVVTECNGEKLKPNDLTWGDKGRLYFTSPYSKTEPLGGVFFIDTDGTCKKFDSDMKFPNGIIYDTEKKVLFVGEEGDDRQVIWKYTLNKDGTKAAKETFFKVDNVGFDGMKMDVEGNLWVAMYGYAQVWAISPAGQKIRAIPIQGANPTNLIFTGPDMKTAYVTVNNRNNGKVFRLPMPWAGRKIIPKKSNNF